jgi:hypothetical protein
LLQSVLGEARASFVQLLTSWDPNMFW